MEAKSTHKVLLSRVGHLAGKFHEIDCRNALLAKKVNSPQENPMQIHMKSINA
jgi:hypothetical protein